MNSRIDELTIETLDDNIEIALEILTNLESGEYTPRMAAQFLFQLVEDCQCHAKDIEYTKYYGTD